MTNGEKIQTILDVNRDCTEVHGENGTMTFTVTQDFWNAEYQESSNSEKPNKSETPTGSTTKDDLRVDAVSRKEVMEQCQEWRNLESVKMTNPYYYLEKRLKALPPVTPQPKTGHWIYSKAVNTGEIIFSECSVCGNGESRCAKRMKYCPNCGTKMVEPQERSGEE